MTTFFNLAVPDVMATELRGRSALLKKEIEKLELQEKAFRSSMPDFHNPRLEELRRELTRELVTKRLVIFGTSHDAQESGDGKNSELEQRLSYLAQMFAPTILMEEWTERRAPSFVCSFANRLGLAYKNVGTPQEEQFQTFYNPVNFPGHNGTLGPQCDAPFVCEYGPLDRQENRELRMAANIQNEMGDHQTGLFVVGLAHLGSISSKVHQAGFNVASYS